MKTQRNLRNPGRVAPFLVLAGVLLPVPATVADNTADCRSWRWANPRPAAHLLTGVAVGPQRIVAVGDRGAILASPAGVSWTAAASGVDADLSGVTWAENAFVAVGEAGTVLRSENGLVWSAVDSGITEDLSAVAHGNGVTVALGSESTLYSTTDGGAWNAHDLGEPTLYDLVWAGTRFVAVGDDVAAVSADGSSWTVADHGIFAGYGPFMLTWNGTVTLAANGFSSCESFDGLDWSCDLNEDRTLSAGRDIAWTGSQYVSAGYAWRFAMRLSGATWITVDQLGGYVPDRWANGVAWTGERAVAVGFASMIAISPTGVEWSQAQVAENSDVDFVALAVGDDRLVAISLIGDVGISFDGFHWEIYAGAAPGPGDAAGDITYGNGRFVAKGGGTGWVATSTDGLSWTANQVGSGNLGAVVWTDGLFYAPMHRRDELVVFSSLDGETWSIEVVYEADAHLLGLTSGTGHTVMVGVEFDQKASAWKNPLVGVLTPDGRWEWNRFSTWPLNSAEILRDVAWGADRWVLATDTGAVITSTDLMQWEVVETGASGRLDTVTWNGDEFLASGRGGVVSSPDGLSWQHETLPTSLSVADTVWSEDAWIAVGLSGTVLQGICDPTLDPPLAGFAVASPAVVADAPILFADASRCAMCTWSWSFGDGGTSSHSDPLHVFSAPGTHQIRQTVCNDAGCDTAERSLVITDTTPIADFTPDKMTLMAGESVLLRDLSAGLPSAWEWRFGDGDRSTDQHPIHTFRESGFYRVTLTAANAHGSDGVSKPVMVAPAGPIDDAVLDGAGFFSDFTRGRHRWVVVGSRGFVASSLTGRRWTAHDSGTDRSLSSVTWTGAAFVAVGNGAIVVSDDGITWRTVIEGGSTPSLSAVAGNAEAVVAVGSYGRVLRSEDLENWVGIDIGTTDNMKDVAADDTLFVVVADTAFASLLESPTGLQWTVAEAALRKAQVVEASFQGFVATDSSGLYWRDANGSWTSGSKLLKSSDGSLNVSDLTVLADGSVAVATHRGGYWVTPQGGMLPLHAPGSVTAIEASESGLYLLGSEGLSTLPMRNMSAPRRVPRLP